MARSLDTPPTVWDEMESLLTNHGFQSYPVPETDDGDTEVGAESTKPRTIIQLVRGAVGVAPNHAGRSTNSFWSSEEMAKTLQKLWDILEIAFKTVQPQQQSLVAWCFNSSDHLAEEIRSVIKEARKLSPDFRTQRYLIRPLSPGLTGVRTPETALINLIGILKVFENVPYGDLLSEIMRQPRQNSILVNELEKRIPRAKWPSADCDRESPIPQLLVRRFSAYLESDSTSAKSLTFISFLEELEDQNNLAGQSDRALAKRLVADPLVGPMPAQIKKLFERHQSS